MTPGSLDTMPDSDERWGPPPPAALAPGEAAPETSAGRGRREAMRAAYVTLLIFTAAYFLQPGEWIPGLGTIPVEKITGGMALIAFGLSAMGQGGFRLRLPREIFYLVALFFQLCLAAVFSTVWKGGAFQIVVMEFSKVVLMIIVLVAAVTTWPRFRKLIFVQVVCICLITLQALLSSVRLEGRLVASISERYSNPNDLALVMALVTPFIFALLLGAGSIVKKAIWVVALCGMAYAVLLTSSRGGLIAFLVAVVVSLWEFGFKGRRIYLILVAGVGIFALLVASSSSRMGERMRAMASPDEDESAYQSRIDRQMLFWRSIDLTKEHPLFGIGSGNFAELSGNWHVTHNTYTELSAEGGIPALVLFLLILWRSFGNLRGARRAARDKPEQLLWIGGLRASLLAFMAGACFISYEYQFVTYFLVAYSSVLYRVSQAQEAGNPLARAEISGSEGAIEEYA
jgi:O-antigen ligase